MGRGVARQPFQRHRDIEHLAGGRVVVIQTLQFLTHRQRVLQRDVQHRRHQFGNAVDFAERYAQRPSDITDRSAGRHGSERDDLRHMVAAIAGRDIFDDFAAPHIAKIDIDIRHRHPLGIEEPFKQQTIFQRVDVGDFQQIGDDAAGSRTPARSHRNFRFTGELDEVPDNQKVAGEAHRLNDRQFVLQTLTHFRPRCRIALRQRRLA